MNRSPAPVDQDARDRAATDLDKTIVVEAAAGTGKTRSLVSRILNAVTTGRARVHEIVAITFTEKAAGELKVRVRAALDCALSGPRLREELANLERAQMTTIHSFCAAILREHPVEAAVDPQFAVADQLRGKLLREQAWAGWLETELAGHPTALRQAMLREVKFEALEELAAKLLRERCRLGDRPWPAPRPLDVGAAFNALVASVPALQGWLRHCVDTSGNLYADARAFCDVLPALANASEQRILAVLSTLQLTTPRRKDQFDSPQAFSGAKRLIEQLKLQLQSFAATANHNFLVELTGWLTGFVAYFQEFKHRRATLDFDDLLLKTRVLLADHPAVLERLRHRIKLLLVDEFQDTDPLQAEIVLKLAGDTPGKLFIVGDPKQSIFSFRAADIEMYADTLRRLEDSGCRLVFQQNFRSRSTILDWVNAVFSQLIHRPDDGDYQPDYIPLRPVPQRVCAEPRVTLLRPSSFPVNQPADASRRVEADAVARYLRAQVEAGACRWGDVAVLFRSFTPVEIYTEVFVERGVPFQVVGGKHYYSRQEIQTLISLLCCLDNPNDKLNLVATLRSPLFGWPDEVVFVTAAADRLDYLRADDDDAPQAVREAFGLLRELHDSRRGLSVAGFLEHALARTGMCQAFFARGPDGAAAVANLLKALELARQLQTAGVRSLRALVRQLRATQPGGVEEEPAPATEGSDAVQLLTMHKSKGLQFGLVVLADLAGKTRDSGPAMVPGPRRGEFELRFEQCRTDGFDQAVVRQKKRERAEEIRLLYVAATRARERLVITQFCETSERLDLLKPGLDGAPGLPLEVIDPASLPQGPAPAEPRTGDPMELAAQRRVWLESHAALLRRASQPVARTSPSQLAGEFEPPMAAQEVARRAGERARDIGATVHAALEIVRWQDPADAQLEQMQRFVAGSGLSGEDQQRARAMLETAVRSPWMQRLRRAEQLWREVPFACRTGQGLMEGKIDLLFCENGRWVLADYKTDARPDPGRYREQLRAYARALEQIAGVTVSERLLFFLASGEVAAVPDGDG
jgi:ATP-dependent helicase/nuclease subunit A